MISDNNIEREPQSLELKYVVSERELEEAKLAVEEAKRAWREEHDARVEAEEAKAAVTLAAESALQETEEMKAKLSKELREAKARVQAAVQAKKIYEEAKAQTEDIKAIWKEACRARAAGRSDKKLLVEAREAEERVEYMLTWIK